MGAAVTGTNRVHTKRKTNTVFLNKIQAKGEERTPETKKNSTQNPQTIYEHQAYVMRFEREQDYGRHSNKKKKIDTIRFGYSIH